MSHAVPLGCASTLHVQAVPHSEKKLVSCVFEGGVLSCMATGVSAYGAKQQESLIIVAIVLR